MKPETALKLQDRIKTEIRGLRKLVEQLADPDTGTTPGGLKSALLIIARSTIRTNQIALEVIAAEAEPPSSTFPFATLFGK